MIDYAAFNAAVKAQDRGRATCVLLAARIDPTEAYKRVEAAINEYHRESLVAFAERALRGFSVVAVIAVCVMIANLPNDLEQCKKSNTVERCYKELRP